MNEERWEQLVEMVRQNFVDVQLYKEDLIMETLDGPLKQGTKDVLEFEHKDGLRYRIVRESRPVVLEKKEHFSHRMGDTARTEYKHSETEFSHKLKVYKEAGFDEWDEVTLDKLGL